MKTPKNQIGTFSLAGCEWRVFLSPDLTEYGYCDNMNHTIHIKDGLTEQSSGVTFYHELVHAMLFTMGHLDQDEQVVDAMGNFLYQFNQTLKFKKEFMA